MHLWVHMDVIRDIQFLNERKKHLLASLLVAI